MVVVIVVVVVVEVVEVVVVLVVVVVVVGTVNGQLEEEQQHIRLAPPKEAVQDGAAPP